MDDKIEPKPDSAIPAEQLKGLLGKIQKISLTPEIMAKAVRTVLRPEVLELYDVQVTDVACDHRLGIPMTDVHVRYVPKDFMDSVTRAARGLAEEHRSPNQGE